ncbi:MAG TPA: tetratricopeptide repeat protein [Thiobacillus sp.]
MRSIVGRKNILSAWYWMAVPLFMVGCANTGGPGQQANMGQALLQEAQQAVASGARTRAQNLLEEATRSNPTDKQPWIRLAQLHFEQNQYAQAITAGQEVLARDNSNLDARSIVLVSSLRIAAKSLEELSISNQLAGDTKTEARKVTHMLRETLGESVLVPANRTAVSSGSKQEDGAESADKASQERAPAKRPTRTTRAKPEIPKPAATSSSSDSDPFHSLR